MSGEPLPQDLSETCRVCCDPAPPNGSVSVFLVHMSKKLMALADVQIWPLDGLPTLICHDCIVKLDTSYQFVKQCESSDRRLRQHLTAKERSVGVSQHRENLESIQELPPAHNSLYAEPAPIKSHSDMLDYTLEDMDRLDIKTENTGYSCKVCMKSFESASKLSKHTYVHSGQKPYQCDFCKKSFSHKSNMKAHAKLHSEDKPYECGVCKKAFKRVKDLVVHKRIHTGEKPHTCDNCGKAFSSSSNLIAHYRIHTGEKPYICPICHKAFVQSNELSKHKKIHTKEKHCCTICTKFFGAASNLAVHMMSHNETNVCHLCHKSFKSSTSLAHHLEKHQFIGHEL